MSVELSFIFFAGSAVGTFMFLPSLPAFFETNWVGYGGMRVCKNVISFIYFAGAAVAKSNPLQPGFFLKPTGWGMSVVE